MSRSRQPRSLNGRIILYVALLCVAIGAMFALRRCNSELYPAARIGQSEGDTLDVAIIYSPMSYYLYDDTIGGFNYDMLRLYAKDQHRPIRFWPVVSLDDALQRLNDRDFDLLASLPIDQEFKVKYAYTSDLFLDRQVLIQRRDSRGMLTVTSSLDLAGETLHIEKDSPIEFRIHNLEREIGATIHIERHPELSSEYLFLKVASGELRYAVVNERVARPLLEHYPEVSIETPVSFTQFQAWVLHPQDTAMLHNLNTWIDSIKQTPVYEQILMRYN